MLSKIKGLAQKLVWKCISDHEQTTPQQLRQEIGTEHISRSRLMEVLAELVAGKFVIRLGGGLYCTVERTVSPAERTECTTDLTESIAGRTVYGGPYTRRPAGRTNCPAERTVGEGKGGEEYSLKKGKERKGRGENFENEEIPLIPVTEIWQKVDRDHPKFVNNRALMQRLMNYAGTSPDLLDRLAAAGFVGVPIDADLLKEWKTEIDRELDRGELDYGWKRLAKLTRMAFEAAGYGWEPCRTPKEIAQEALAEALKKKAKTAVDSTGPPKAAAPKGKPKGPSSAVADRSSGPIREVSKTEILSQEREQRAIERAYQDALLKSGGEIPPMTRVRGRPGKLAKAG